VESDYGAWNEYLEALFHGEPTDWDCASRTDRERRL
jgi:hypothetical protein